MLNFRNSWIIKLCNGSCFLTVSKIENIFLGGFLSACLDNSHGKHVIFHKMEPLGLKLNEMYRRALQTISGHQTIAIIKLYQFGRKCTSI